MADDDIEIETINEKLRRFRNAPPMSKQERFRQFGESKPMWWEDSSAELKWTAKSRSDRGGNNNDDAALLASVDTLEESNISAHPLGHSTLPIPSLPPSRRETASSESNYSKNRTADVGYLRKELLAIEQERAAVAAAAETRSRSGSGSSHPGSPERRGVSGGYRKDSALLGRYSPEKHKAPAERSASEVAKRLLVSSIDAERDNLDGWGGNSRGAGTAGNYGRSLGDALNEGGEGYRRDLAGALRANTSQQQQSLLQERSSRSQYSEAAHAIAQRNFERDMEGSDSSLGLGLGLGDFKLDIGVTGSLRLPDVTLGMTSSYGGDGDGDGDGDGEDGNGGKFAMTGNTQYSSNFGSDLSEATGLGATTSNHSSSSSSNHGNGNRYKNNRGNKNSEESGDGTGEHLELEPSIPELKGMTGELTGLLAHLKQSERRINDILTGTVSVPATAGGATNDNIYSANNGGLPPTGQRTINKNSSSSTEDGPIAIAMTAAAAAGAGAPGAELTEEQRKLIEDSRRAEEWRLITQRMEEVATTETLTFAGHYMYEGQATAQAAQKRGVADLDALELMGDDAEGGVGDGERWRDREEREYYLAMRRQQIQQMQKQGEQYGDGQHTPWLGLHPTMDLFLGNTGDSDGDNNRGGGGDGVAAASSSSSEDEQSPIEGSAVIASTNSDLSKALLRGHQPPKRYATSIPGMSSHRPQQQQQQQQQQQHPGGNYNPQQQGGSGSSGLKHGNNNEDGNNELPPSNANPPTPYEVQPPPVSVPAPILVGGIASAVAPASVYADITSKVVDPVLPPPPTSGEEKSNFTADLEDSYNYTSDDGSGSGSGSGNKNINNNGGGDDDHDGHGSPHTAHAAAFVTKMLSSSLKKMSPGRVADSEEGEDGSGGSGGSDGGNHENTTTNNSSKKLRPKPLLAPPGPVSAVQEKAGGLVSGIVDSVVDNIVSLQSPLSRRGGGRGGGKANGNGDNSSSSGGGGGSGGGLVDFPPPPELPEPLLPPPTPKVAAAAAAAAAAQPALAPAVASPVPAPARARAPVVAAPAPTPDHILTEAEMKEQAQQRADKQEDETIQRRLTELHDAEIALQVEINRIKARYEQKQANPDLSAATAAAAAAVAEKPATATAAVSANAVPPPIRPITVTVTTKTKPKPAPPLPTSPPKRNAYFTPFVEVQQSAVPAPAPAPPAPFRVARSTGGGSGGYYYPPDGGGGGGSGHYHAAGENAGGNKAININNNNNSSGAYAAATAKPRTAAASCYPHSGGNENPASTSASAAGVLKGAPDADSNAAEKAKYLQRSRALRQKLLLGGGGGGGGGL
jgi:hypothetical protein